MRPRGPEGRLFSLHREMNRIREDFRRSFDLAELWGWANGGFDPRTDVRETDDALLVTAEMPGLEEKDFEFNLTEGLLTLKGEKRQEPEERGAFHRLERVYGSFQRTIQLPCEVVAEEATAEYRTGVLTITLPKAPSAERPVQRIEVKTG